MVNRININFSHFMALRGSSAPYWPPRHTQKKFFFLLLPGMHFCVMTMGVNDHGFRNNGELILHFWISLGWLFPFLARICTCWAACS